MDEEEKSWELFFKSEGFFQEGGKLLEEKNYIEAVKNFEKATELNHSSAMEQLAYMYTYGIGIDRDIEKAVGYLEKFIDIARDDGVDFSFGKCIKAGVQAAYFGSKYALDKVAEIYLESLLAEENKDSDSDTWGKYNFFLNHLHCWQRATDLISLRIRYIATKMSTNYLLIKHISVFM